MQKSKAERIADADRFSVGDSVLIVDRHQGWTAGEIELYGGCYGVVSQIGLAVTPHRILVQLREGRCAGEHRWFAVSEIVGG